MVIVIFHSWRCDEAATVAVVIALSYATTPVLFCDANASTNRFFKFRLFTIVISSTRKDVINQLTSTSDQNIAYLFENKKTQWKIPYKHNNSWNCHNYVNHEYCDERRSAFFFLFFPPFWNLCEHEIDKLSAEVSNSRIYSIINVIFELLRLYCHLKRDFSLCLRRFFVNRSFLVLSSKCCEPSTNTNLARSFPSNVGEKDRHEKNQKVTGVAFLSYFQKYYRLVQRCKNVPEDFCTRFDLKNLMLQFKSNCVHSF